MDDCSACSPSEADYRRNVRSIFVTVLFAGASTSVALGPLFDAYLLNLGSEMQKGNALVGSVESVRGLLQLILAYPIGALSDRMSRVRLVRCNLPFWSLGLCLAIAGVFWDILPLIFVGISLFAPGSQCWQSTSQVMVADYSHPERRTRVVSNMSSLRLIANSIGPLLQVMILLMLGQDHWSNWLLRWVVSAGCLLWPGVIFGTSRLQDLPALEKVSRSGNSAASSFDVEALERCVFGVKVRWLIAGTLELASFITAIGAGMTVKFFPLFFRVDYKFTPVQVCLLSFAYPLCISAMMQICRRVGDRLGRLHASLLFHFLATSCLWAMCYCRSLYLVLPFFLLRGALMNARGPVIRAMVMDLVTTDMRGRWNSIQSISGFTWSGSAALGGIIADAAGDYRFTFKVTAMIYSVSFMILLPLLVIYPAEQRAKARAPEDERASQTNCVANTRGALPLLEFSQSREPAQIQR
eukprot:TRINITY_DN49085_c0_g1_i1.p1 TRINITY_DN49085_c0_g1~~TRINITY_DN49085_c0_g1_i1.p1  ORF type:complete len:468 (+),score=42.82 TRINITY_DN49085_c0_g1_i1:179-1582(+)